MTLSTRCPSQRDSDIHWGSREVGDPGCGRSSVSGLGEPGVSSHHWRVYDDCRECVGGDLLWVGLDDVGEMTVVAMQVASES